MREEGVSQMIKCFWCGTANPRGETVCAECKRELQWSRFLRAVLKPAAGLLLRSAGGAVRTDIRPMGAPVGS